MSSYHLIFAAQDLQRNCDRWDSKAEPSLLDQSSLDGDDRGLSEQFFFPFPIGSMYGIYSNIKGVY